MLNQNVELPTSPSPAYFQQMLAKLDQCEQLLREEHQALGLEWQAKSDQHKSYKTRRDNLIRMKDQPQSPNERERKILNRNMRGCLNACNDIVAKQEAIKAQIIDIMEQRNQLKQQQIAYAVNLVTRIGEDFATLSRYKAILAERDTMANAQPSSCAAAALKPGISRFT